MDTSKALELKEALLNASTPEAKTKAMQAIIAFIADDLKPEAVELVKLIEAKPETTRNHYGDYLHHLTNCPSKMVQAGWVHALRLAGANEQGLNDAINLLS
jgi:hypothetical protein